jgi:hypothetical protein
MSGIDAVIVKCSHCKRILSSEEFETHKCELQLVDQKTIPVVYFLDTSCNGKKIMAGWGVDGVLYTFEVVPRKPIPYMKSLSDDSYHDDNDPTPSYQSLVLHHRLSASMTICFCNIAS